MKDWKKPPLGAQTKKSELIGDRGIVLCEIPKRPTEQHTNYVVWNYNTKTGGYYQGQYTNSLKFAHEEFDDRSTRYNQALTT